ncbi:AAA family ATPase [Qingshengfaniella alkalisoli]|uniref:AAA family ATPase n=1 Tax=Qingshengfaniella alkalisoli TaxID=2599296 RepID=A0A5B8IUB9_9RHOB|nr:AAA family ATPase [Qingshengfaniella alkalisoli]QDY69712.1 AAA family ATPase [Qingshengfaniella alkalisoli]
MRPLSSLGNRIVVLGPSNAGKSTLAVAIANKLDMPVVHLDRLHHLPNTDWQPRPEADFVALHDAAIRQESWVMDGNYSRLMPDRFARATGVILITSNRWLRVSRYLKRTLVNQSTRAGHLEGAQESLKWAMVHWILIARAASAAKYAGMIEASGLPSVQCHTAKELMSLYRKWDLPPPR